MTIKSLAVFCGSKSGNNSLYYTQAVQLGHLLAEKNITLVYGGGNKGLMGAIANAVLERGGKVIGIMPRILAGVEHSHTGLTEMIEVEDMHARKKMLYEKCDAAVILPGGYGTMDEFFEMLTWNQLNIHNKHIYVLNTDGFYSHLISFLQKMEEDNFLYHKIIDRIIVVPAPEFLNFE
ncbi:MAG: TIGR00730 family Rossman fold protein [Ginsengibacter sp.]